MTAFGVQQTSDIEDLLYCEQERDGDVTVDEDGIMLINGCEGTRYEYPFRVSELRELAAEEG